MSSSSPALPPSSRFLSSGRPGAAVFSAGAPCRLCGAVGGALCSGVCPRCVAGLVPFPFRFGGLRLRPAVPGVAGPPGFPACPGPRPCPPRVLSLLGPAFCAACGSGAPGPVAPLASRRVPLAVPLARLRRPALRFCPCSCGGSALVLRSGAASPFAWCGSCGSCFRAPAPSRWRSSRAACVVVLPLALFPGLVS